MCVRGTHTHQREEEPQLGNLENTVKNAHSPSVNLEVLGGISGKCIHELDCEGCMSCPEEEG